MLNQKKRKLKGENGQSDAFFFFYEIKCLKRKKNKGIKIWVLFLAASLCTIILAKFLNNKLHLNVINFFVHQNLSTNERKMIWKFWEILCNCQLYEWLCMLEAISLFIFMFYIIFFSSYFNQCCSLSLFVKNVNIKFVYVCIYI